LIFSQKKPNPEHLARYALADLFLDTFPYGSHTTASDAMWMGVPILTMPGKGFASRVCASLVRAAGMSELICGGLQDYVERAVALGGRPNDVKALKQKLLAARADCLLFDTPRLIRALEELYKSMWDEYRRGALPTPDLSNLDLYEEIGVEIGAEDVTYRSDESYRTLYASRLQEHDAIRAVRPDGRLWKASRP
jgi:hypothetical protein